MDVSYFLVTQSASTRPLDGITDEFVRQTEMVRDGGFDSLFVGEHHATDDNYFLNEAVIAYLANHTGDMNIGTGMCLLPYHNPVRIAEFGATVDHLTDGRFRLGVVQGYRPEEYDVFGVNQENACSLRRGRAGDNAPLDRGERDLRRDGLLVRRREYQSSPRSGPSTGDHRRRQ